MGYWLKNRVFLVALAAAVLFNLAAALLISALPLKEKGPGETITLEVTVSTPTPAPTEASPPEPPPRPTARPKAAAPAVRLVASKRPVKPKQISTPKPTAAPTPPPPPPPNKEAENPEAAKEVKTVFGLSEDSFSEKSPETEEEKAAAAPRGNTLMIDPADSAKNAEPEEYASNVYSIGEKAPRYYTIQDVDLLPGWKKRALPRYPPALRRRGREGQVKIEVLLSDAGEIESAKVVEATNEEFARAALEALRDSRFSPAMVHGEAVAIRLIVPYRFSLRD